MSRFRRRGNRHRCGALGLGTLALACFLASTTTTPARAEQENSAVRLRSGNLAGPGDDAGLPARLLLTPAEVSGGGPAILKFASSITPQLRSAVERAGVTLEAWLGRQAFIAVLPPGGLEEVRGLPGVTWAAPYHPGLRLAPEIAAIEETDLRSLVPVTIHLFSWADAEVVASRLASLGLAVGGLASGSAAGERTSVRPGRIVLLPTPWQLVASRERIARWPEVLWLGIRPTYRLLNDTSAWVCQSGLDGGQSTPVHNHGILGQGQVIAILDTGLDADMCFFRDAVRGLPPVNVGFGTGSPDPLQRKVTIVNFLWSGDSPSDPTDWDNQDHGTHVAGTAAGDNLATPGVRDPADGMAPAAKLVIQDGGYAVDNCADLPAIGCPAADLYPFFAQAYLQGARIHSNSYGDRENFTPFNIYSDGSEAADAFMWDHPDFLLVFAAGNNGPGVATVASPATAKNVLAVGATNRAASAGSLASFSSQGPTHDGRFKPDVTAPGSSIVSANNDLNINTNNCGTKSSSGTSMACPTAAGLAALVREYYEKGFHPTGSATPADAFLPSAALVKATLIVSAKAMEQVAAPPPSGPQGWGRLLLDDALYFSGDAKHLFAVDVPARFGSPADPVDVHTLEVLDAGQPLRIALTWTDYPSTPAAVQNLVNDLDLEVQSPSGTIYLGNVFSGGVSQSGGVRDSINNVEAVRIEAPQPGSWIVRVRPRAIPQPAQGYALVATGRLPAGGIVLERTSLTLDDGVGGNDDGILDPGEWVDLSLGLVNSGDTAAADVRVSLESLTPSVQVIQPEVTLGSLASGQQAGTAPPQLRIRLVPSMVCNAPLTLRFRYLAEGYARTEDTTLSTGSESTFLADDLEGATGWQHVAAQSTATAGAWTLGNPDGTAYQPEDDATPGAGTRCLFTAPNPGGVGTDDVDDGVVVARSGPYNLSGHPEARLRIARWFGNRDVGLDSGDFFRLDIRQNASSADVLLEQLGTAVNAPFWTAVTFRVADFITPGAGVELAASAADGQSLAPGNLIEAAIDEVVFWEPLCAIHDPVPRAVNSLLLGRAGNDVVLVWNRPPADPTHGETARYRVHKSATPTGGFVLQVELTDPGASPGWTDVGGALGPGISFYQVIAGNGAGDAEPLP